jgi:diguanylate cyclase (GGDEF)-like protein/PAS domain S-box-containing protein
VRLFAIESACLSARQTGEIAMKFMAWPARWLSLVILVAGASVMAGWATHTAWLTTIVPGQVPMVFNTGLCFFLLGLALFLLPLGGTNARRTVARLCALTVLALSVINLLQIVGDLSLGINLPTLHAWNSANSVRPGRMPLASTLCFVFAALALLLLVGRHPGLAVIAMSFGTVPFGIGLTVILSYVMHLESLYAWYPLNQMTLPTGVGMLILSAALWPVVLRTSALHVYSEDRQIIAVGTTALLVVALVAVFSGVWLLRTQGVPALQANLQLAREARADLLMLDLRSATARAVDAVAQASLAPAMSSALRASDSADARQSLQAVATALLARGMRGVQVNGAGGIVLAKVGASIEPLIGALPIRATAGAAHEVVWHDGLLLRTRVELGNEGVKQGELVMDQPLSLMQSRLQSGTYLNAAVTTLLCGRVSATSVSCMRIGSGDSTPISDQSGNHLAALTNSAIAGSTGISRAQTSEGVPTDVVAYGPVGSTGLALLVQLDATSLYAPIRRGMLWGLGIVLVVVVVSATWLRRRIRALVRRLVTTESRYKAVVESLHDGLLLQDANAKILASNPAARRILGLDEAELRGRSSLDSMWKTIHEDGSDWPGVDHPAPRTLRTCQPETGVIMGVQPPQGKLSWLSINTVLTRGDGPDDERAVITSFSDITARRSAEKQLAQSNQLRQAILDAASFSIIATDEDGLIMAVNPGTERMLWYKADELIGKMTLLVLHDPLEVATRAEELSNALGKRVEAGFEVFVHKSRFGVTDEREWTYVRKDGSRFPVNLTTTALRDERQQITGFLGIAYDITERKHQEEYARHVAHHDFLTGLPNRMLLNDRLYIAIERARRDGCKVAAMMIDLDHFKRVNDSLGHHIGDELLKIVAGRILACVRRSDTVARMGGDEFAVLISDVKSERDIEQVAEKIIESVSQPAQVGGHELHISASIGISQYPVDGEDLHALLVDADTAMYEAKLAGRKTYRLFSREMELAAKAKLELESELQLALTHGEFQLHYQPQVSLQDDRVQGMEALLRWYSPKRGLVSPNDFILIAEHSSLIVEIGDWVLVNACRDMAALNRRTGQRLRVAVNLSPRQFLQNDLVLQVQRVLDETGLSPACLELEITEGVLMDRSAETIDRLQKLRELGVLIAVDDFGVGFSSLSYITQFPISTLKIDRVFVDRLPDSPSDAAVTLAIIALAHSLNMMVVAEGVETAGQLDYLRLHGCDFVQGYFLGRPQPMDAVMVADGSDH